MSDEIEFPGWLKAVMKSIEDSANMAAVLRYWETHHTIAVENEWEPLCYEDQFNWGAMACQRCPWAEECEKAYYKSNPGSI